MNKTAVIISGGSLNESFARKVIDHVKPQIRIGADRGLLFFHANDVMPTHIVGDFDSLDERLLVEYENRSDVTIRRYNPIKDSTDTEIAITLCTTLGVDTVILLGATGSRLDHVLGNIQCLKILQRAGIKGYILDEQNRISLLQTQTILRRENAFGDYFSLFSLGGVAEHVNVTGAKYPLTDHMLSPYDSLCVSNEYAEDTVRIQFESGTVVLIESRD